MGANNTSKATTRTSVRGDKSFTAKGSNEGKKIDVSEGLRTKTRVGTDPKLSESKGTITHVDGSKY